ncbi:MAG: ubiquinol-cytochrome c reductase iron-sulfur subunit [Gemmatimonadales bacterium]
MNRRDFLARVEALSACAAAAGLTLPLGGCLGFHYVNTSLTGNRLVIRSADFGDRRFALADVPGFRLPIYVYRLDDGGYSAVSTRCMHRGCQVEPAAEHLVCPCHGSEYTNTGEVLKGPTQLPLRKLPVRVERENIVIELPTTGDDW